MPKIIEVKSIEEIEQRLSKDQRAFRDEISNWLETYPWTKTWTVTFDRMEQRLTQNYTKTGHWKGRPRQVGISEWNAKKYFERYMTKIHPDMSWFYCVEPNPGRQGHHLHALMCPPTGGKISHKDLGTTWWNTYGWNKVEDIRSKKDISGYCTKHVVAYLNKGSGWYNIQINDSDIFHGRRGKEKVLSE